MDIIIFSGNVGKTPEMRYTPTGQAVTSFSVAVNRKWSDDKGEHKETKWFRVATWGKLAENCNQYVTKGMKVIVTGRLQCDPTTGGPKIFTRQDGTSGSAFEVTATGVEFGASAEGAGGQNAPQHAEGGAELPDEGDIPF
jgi:single-strand DNA-binding protein